MKKWMAIPALAGAIVLGGVTMVANADKSETKTEIKTESAGFLTVEEVEKKAVEAVGGHVTEIEYEKSKGIYEVEVKNEGTEYDLDIDAATGDIIYEDKSVEKERGNSLTVLEADKNKKNFKVDAKHITADEAIAIAMKKAQGKVTDLELDEDDGRAYYEIDIEDGVYEYEFEIDAITGEVLDFEKNRDDD